TLKLGGPRTFLSALPPFQSASRADKNVRGPMKHRPQRKNHGAWPGFSFGRAVGSAAVELDHHRGFHLHRIWHIRQLGAAHEVALAILVLDLDIVRNIALPS